MTIFTLPLCHIKAKWPRALLLTAVFTLGLASMSGLYHISTLIAENMEKKLAGYGANILITPRHESLQISYGGYSLGNVVMEELPLDLDAAFKGIKGMPLRANIAVISPKMLSMTRIADQTAVLVGVDWEQELQLKGYWEVEGDFPQENSASEMLAGAVAARKLNLAPGRILSIGGREMRLSGILKPTGSDDDMALFVPLALAQSMAGKPGRASFLEVAALCSGCPIDDIVTQLRAALPGSEVRALSQVAESRMYSIHFAGNLAFSISLVILVTACAMLIMSMLSSVAERRREIGIMRAVGFPRAGIFTVFVSEAALIGLFSGFMGYILGQILTAHILGRLHLTDEAAWGFEPTAFLALVFIAAASAALAAAFPAWRASLVEPAEALISL